MVLVFDLAVLDLEFLVGRDGDWIRPGSWSWGGVLILSCVGLGGLTGWAAIFLLEQEFGDNEGRNNANQVSDSEYGQGFWFGFVFDQELEAFGESVGLGFGHGVF